MQIVRPEYITQGTTEHLEKIMATEVITPPLNQQDESWDKQPRHVLLQGRPHPLGATASKKGTNFAIFSEDATRVDLCLFDSAGKQIAFSYASEPRSSGTASLWEDH